MSSLTRRMQIRGLKARGSVRTKYRVAVGDDGQPTLKPVRRGGLIIDPQDEPVGYRWPRRAQAAAR